MAETDNLSRRERQIMEVIFAKGRATAVEVLDALPDPPSRTAVRTLLSILEQKGHLTHDKDGLTYVYRPVESRADVGQSAFRRVLQVFFDGSLEKAMAAHLADSDSDLSSDELKRLASLIQQARQKGQ